VGQLGSSWRKRSKILPTRFGLTAVPLHDAFSWAYAHFVLEDEMRLSPETVDAASSLTRQVLHYAAAVA